MCKYICENCLKEELSNDFYTLIPEERYSGMCSYCNYSFDEIISVKKFAESLFVNFNNNYEPDPYGYDDNGENIKDLYDILGETYGISGSSDLGKELISLSEYNSDDEFYCPHHYEDTNDEVMAYQWDEFCKHCTDFNMIYPKILTEKIKEYRGVPKTTINSFLMELLNYTLSNDEYFTILPEKATLYRARTDDKNYFSIASDLGSPPAKDAPNNRFSPEGISMFYGAELQETCINEVKKHSGKLCKISIGKWHTNKEMKLLDLTKNIPFSEFKNRILNGFDCISPFSSKSRHNYNIIFERYIFKFAHGLMKEIKSDIDYIPTQVITKFYIDNVHDLSGIKYYSHDNGEKSVVLFASHSDCADNTTINTNNKLLILQNVEHKQY